jgi:O-antigen/teichoic acid export membrane protein/O-antigen ligase
VSTAGPRWLLFAAPPAAVGLGVLVVESRRAAYAMAVGVLLAALVASVARLPFARVFAAAIVLTSALVDVPGRIHVGRFSVNAGVTVVLALTGALAAMSFWRDRDRGATAPVRSFLALAIYGLVSIIRGVPSIDAAQNVLVLVIFVTALYCGVKIGMYDASPYQFASALFGLGSVIAMTLYAASVATGGLGAGGVIGARSYALFALISMAWGASGWRYGARYALPVTLVAGLLILLSLSRTAFAVALMVGSLAWFNPRSLGGWLRLTAGLGAAAGCGYFAVQHIHSLHQHFFGGDVHVIGAGISINLAGRGRLWSAVWHSFLTSPWFGHGVGTAEQFVFRTFGETIAHPHNDYLRLLHDYGLIGTCLWSFGYIWLLRRSWRAWHRSEGDGSESTPASSNEVRRVQSAAFLALTAAALAMVTDNVIVYGFVMGPLGVLAGLALGLDARRGSTSRERARGSRLLPAPPPAFYTPAYPGLIRLARLQRAGTTGPPTRLPWPGGGQQLSTQRNATVALRGRPRLAGSLVRGFGLNFAGGIASAVLGFIFTVAITHALPTAQAGVFFEAIALFSILIVVAQLGASATIVKMVSEYRAVGRFSDIRLGVGAALFPTALFSVVIAVALFRFAEPLATVIVKHGDQREAATYLRTLSPFVPIGALFAVLLGATRGGGTMVPTFVLDSIGKPAFRAVVAVLASFVALSPLALGALWAAPLALALVAACFSLARLLRRLSEQATPPRTPQDSRGRYVLREYWVFTAPQWVSDVFQLAVLWLDVVLVGALASAREAGVYTAVSRLVTVGTLGLTAAALVLGPVFSALLATGELQRIQALYRQVTLWLAAGSVPVFILMATFSPVIVRVFGPGFGSGATALVILCLGMLIDVVAGPAPLTLLMGGRSRMLLANGAAGFTANIALNVVLIPRYGMTGAAIAWDTSILIGNLLAILQIRRLWGVSCFHRSVGTITCGAAVCYGVISLFSLGIGGERSATLVVSALAGTLLYAVVVWMMRASLDLQVFRLALRMRSVAKT